MNNFTKEEFEPITPENIEEVLQYNGFVKDSNTMLHYTKADIKFTIYVHSYCCIVNRLNYIQHKDLNKVLDFMREFIDLKPLRKTIDIDLAFGIRKFLLDNGCELTQDNYEIFIKAAKLFKDLK